MIFQGGQGRSKGTAEPWRLRRFLRSWQPPFRFRDEDAVAVTVGFEETLLRDRLRKLRGRWDTEKKVWLVPYGKIRGTELEARIPAEFLGRGGKR